VQTIGAYSEVTKYRIFHIRMVL